ncbi:MAG: cellobiose phosphorylase [Candidatus Fournierella pullistercoris]|uniref:Cellobiose phosphorylase n=1 Tax=Candidatus Allofournierella pullistercoris TaxID=2838597 RepID=A0A948WQS3_9FIRM|nr:cellobiose phosphorylase [Candidatus Fournierella pullistercoris]
MSGISFLNSQGDFTLSQPENYTGLAFPLAGDTGLKSCVTPMLGGDAKLDQHHFVLEPVSIENLHNNRSTRNVWCRFGDGTIWSVSGASAAQEAQRFTPQQEPSQMQGNLLHHQTSRTCAHNGLVAKTDSFVLRDGSQEMLWVTLENPTQTAISLCCIGAIPLYGRSADNLRDHRHVTSLLHRIQVVEQGVVVSPTLTFDERGHKPCTDHYFVLGCDGAGNPPQAIYPTVSQFLGEGGSFLNPMAVRQPIPGQPMGSQLEGQEAMGSMAFAPVTLGSGERVQYLFRLGCTPDSDTFACLAAEHWDASKVEKALQACRQHWQQAVNLQFESGDATRDGYHRWIGVQPILRRIFGCSFLPYHDYGKGGRGWRDLWQDCLALLLMDPAPVRSMICSNFAGVRMDGTNATIIGDQPGEFVADRNNITRVWMDHAFWPFLTTQFYLHQTGDLPFLLETAPYFRDGQILRGSQRDETWNPQLGHWHTTNQGQTYQGSLLEHLLIQNLTAFYDVGDHGHLRLHSADWNDAVDMAWEKGESVAFTSAYAGNLSQLADLLEKVEETLDCHELELATPLCQLLGNQSAYDQIQEKRNILSGYQTLVTQPIAQTSRVRISALVEDLRSKSAWMMQHIRQTEWLDDPAGGGWFNGYYDNESRRVEGFVDGEARMILTSQVFAILSGTATPQQVQAICQAADRYLYRPGVGGYRLNTRFSTPNFALGRMFGFAYGEKENGAVFCHMAVMYANALYRRGCPAAGWKVLDALLQAAMDFETSRMYPGLPEYFNGEGRGLYPYLTGAASWYLMTLLCQVYGIRGEWGDLCIAPALDQSVFDENRQTGVHLTFAGQTLHVVIQHQGNPGAPVESAWMGDTALPVADGQVRIARSLLTSKSSAAPLEIRVLLAN